MIPGRLSHRREFTLVPSLSSRKETLLAGYKSAGRLPKRKESTFTAVHQNLGRSKETLLAGYKSAGRLPKRRESTFTAVHQNLVFD